MKQHYERIDTSSIELTEIGRGKVIPFYVEMYDFEHSVEEDRYIAIGKVGEVLFVVFTERKERIRLISARVATPLEKELYYDQNIQY